MAGMPGVSSGISAARCARNAAACSTSGNATKGAMVAPPERIRLVIRWKTSSSSWRDAATSCPPTTWAGRVPDAASSAARDVSLLSSTSPFVPPA